MSKNLGICFFISTRAIYVESTGWASTDIITLRYEYHEIPMKNE